MGELTQGAWQRAAQVMIEGPGRIPIDQLEMKVRSQGSDLPRVLPFTSSAR